MAWAVVVTGALCTTRAGAAEACFERLDTGVDTAGWHRGTTNHHGPGEGWTFEDGALVGRQSPGKRGGILMTDRSFSDVEVVFEVKIDWGCDSGMFFRTTDDDRAYQVNVDHLPEGGVGTIWGEMFTTELRQIPYFLTDQGNSAVAAPGQTPIFDVGKWSTMWHPTEFNEVRSRVEGNPPHMQVWVSGVKVMDFTDTVLRAEVNESGPLAIQVHFGDRWANGGAVRYRNIRVKDLKLPCADPVSPGAGGTPGAQAGASASGGTDAAPTGGAASGGGAASSGGAASGGASQASVGGGNGGAGFGAAGGASVGGAGAASMLPSRSTSSAAGSCAVSLAATRPAPTLLATLLLAIGACYRRRAKSKNGKRFKGAERSVPGARPPRQLSPRSHLLLEGTR